MGINFNDLPKALQTKLSPFMAPGVSVENAIETAKKMGKWSESDSAKLATLNGEKLWGQFDSFEPSKAKDYKLMAVAKEAKEAKSPKPQKQESSNAGNVAAAMTAGAVIGGFAAGPGGAVVGGLAGALISCGPKSDDPHIYENNNNNNNQINVNVTIKNDFTVLENAIKQLINQTKNDNAATHDLLERILGEITLLKEGQNLTRTQLAAKLQDILDALGSNNYLLQLMIQGIGSNKDLLEIMIEKLTENNKELAQIKSGLDVKYQNDAEYQKKVLEILASIKSAIAELGDLGTQVQTIVNAMVKAGADLAEIKAFLKKINDNVEALKGLTVQFGTEGINLGKQILEAINNLNIGSTDVTAIVNAVKENGQHIKDLTKLLEKINNNIEKGNADAEVRGQKIIEAIEKLGVKVSYDLNVILNKIPEDKDYSTVLNAILAKIGDVDAGNRANFNKVLDALAKIAANQKDVDLQPIIDKLQEILQAIKDHKVIVDVTGKVTCECSCGDKGKHEGIIGDLQDLLG